MFPKVIQSSTLWERFQNHLDTRKPPKPDPKIQPEGLLVVG